MDYWLLLFFEVAKRTEHLVWNNWTPKIEVRLDGQTFPLVYDRTPDRTAQYVPAGLRPVPYLDLLPRTGLTSNNGRNLTE